MNMNKEWAMIKMDVVELLYERYVTESGFRFLEDTNIREVFYHCCWNPFWDNKYEKFDHVRRDTFAWIRAFLEEPLDTGMQTKIKKMKARMERVIENLRSRMLLEIPSRLDIHQVLFCYIFFWFYVKGCITLALHFDKEKKP